MKTKVLTVILISMFAIVALVACGGASETPTGSNYEQPVSTPEQVEQPNPEPTPEPVGNKTIEVPDLIGVPLEEAIEIFEGLGFVLLQDFTELLNAENDFIDIIAEINPSPGTIVDFGSGIILGIGIYRPDRDVNPTPVPIIIFSKEAWKEMIDLIEINFEVTEENFDEAWESFLNDVSAVYNKYIENEIDENEYKRQLNDIRDTSFIYAFALSEKLRHDKDLGILFDLQNKAYSSLTDEAFKCDIVRGILRYYLQWIWVG